MFMAAGLMYKALGHDRIAELGGIGRALPLSVLTFALAGLALMGLPPSGAYAAKKLFFDAAAGSGQWWWELALDAGGFLTASYVVLVLGHALWPGAGRVEPRVPVSRLAELAALALAVCSLGLGLATGDGLDAISSAFAPAELGSALLLLLGGAALAAGLARRLPPVPVSEAMIAMLRPLRGATVVVGGLLAYTDGMLRQWPVAALALIAVTIAFGAAILAGS